MPEVFHFDREQALIVMEFMTPHTILRQNLIEGIAHPGLADFLGRFCARTLFRGSDLSMTAPERRADLALFADNGVPFYVALPSPTIDWTVSDGLAEIPIEERSGDEVTRVWGKRDDGVLDWVRICPEATRGGNPAFDVTPARLVTGLITERGICAASPEGLAGLFPDRLSA